MTVPVLATVRLPKKSGILADRPTMDFVFDAADIGGTTIANLTSKLHDFFTLATTSGFALQSFLSPSLAVSPATCDVNYYDLTGHLAGTPHGSPVFSQSFTLSALGADPPSPDQVACVLSLQGNYGTDVEFGSGTRPRARDRGRIYIGPLASGNVIGADATTHEPVFANSFLVTLTLAAARLRDAAVGWSVWSRKNALLKPVVLGHADNRPDIQRRRAQAPTARVSF